MSNKNLKFSTKSTKSLYKAGLDLLTEIKNETDPKAIEEMLSVWVTISQLVDYSIEQFVRLEEISDRSLFIEKFEEGINNIPDEVSVDDLIKDSFYNKNNLPQA
jgi:hypothetical protein